MMEAGIRGLTGQPDFSAWGGSYSDCPVRTIGREKEFQLHPDKKTGTVFAPSRLRSV